MLNQTGVQQIAIVEKDSKAVISRAVFGNSSFQESEPTKMAEPTMPSGRISTSVMGDNDVYQEEVVCFCIKRTKEITKKERLLDHAY